MLELMRHHELSVAEAGSRWRVLRWWRRTKRRMEGQMLAIGDGTSPPAEPSLPAPAAVGPTPLD